MPEDTDLNFLLWGTRAFAVLGGLLLAALLGVIWWWIVRPVLTEGMRAQSAGNWWLPYLPREDGSFGPLANNRWWSAMRASEPGSPAGLAVRWGFWVFVAIALTTGLVRGAIQLVQLVGRAFS